MDFFNGIRNKREVFFSPLIIFLLFISFNAFSQNSIEGVWKSEDGKYMMKIATIGEEVQGRIVWMQQEKDDKGNPKMDLKNPDEKLRKLPIKGSKILNDLKYVSPNNWQGGTIYLPETGNSYKCSAEIKGERLIFSYNTSSGQKSWNWVKSK